MNTILLQINHQNTSNRYTSTVSRVTNSGSLKATPSISAVTSSYWHNIRCFNMRGFQGFAVNETGITDTQYPQSIEPEQDSPTASS